MSRRLLYLVIFPICLTVTLAITITEGALRVPGEWRKTPVASMADGVAHAAGASWSEVSMAAGDGARLQAWLFRPKHPNGDAVIVLHGHIDTRKGVLGHAAMLLRNGYAVLAPDSRGHGSSGGELVTFGVAESEDTRRWGRWLRDGAGARRVYGLGESMGASILLQAAAVDSPFGAIVAEGSFSSFRAIAYDRMSQRFGMPRSVARVLMAPLVEPALVYARLRYGVDLAAASPLEAIRGARTPVLLIHGDGDLNVTPDHSEELALARVGVAIWKPAGTGHVGAISMYPAEFEKRVVSWFRSNP